MTKITNSCDQTLFNRDLGNLLSSQQCENKILLVDELFIRLKFDIPVDNRMAIYPVKSCIRLMIERPDKYQLLTTCLIADSSQTRGPAKRIACRDLLSACGHYHIAEAHCNIYSYDKKVSEYFRICYYAVEGATNKVTMLYRFENGRVIGESNLQLGEELLNIANYPGPGKYMADRRAMGVGQPPLTWCNAVAKTMGKYNIGFPSAVKIMAEKGAFFESGGVIIHNLAVEI